MYVAESLVQEKDKCQCEGDQKRFCRHPEVLTRNATCQGIRSREEGDT